MFHLTDAQDAREFNNIIKIEIWRDSILNKSDSIKLIQVIAHDTVITIPLRNSRSINKFTSWNKREHELKLVVGNDTMSFSFQKQIEDYLSVHSPVALWAIRIFTDSDYAGKYYRGTAFSKEVKKYRIIYTFTCDWCDEELFNPIN